MRRVDRSRVRGVAVVVASAWVAAGAAGGVYSLGLADNANVHDAPVPGFVGPAGEGRVRVAGDAVLGEQVVNPLFLSWASEVVAYAPVEGSLVGGEVIVDAYWRFPEEALGPVTGDPFAVVSLGDLDAARIAAGVAPGSLTVRFAAPIVDLEGADFVVFENGFVADSSVGGVGAGGVVAELAHVEASSDGVNFARFPAVSGTLAPVGPYGSIDPTVVFNLAGKHVNAGGRSWGTPFDLSALASDAAVVAGTVDLRAITHVRLVDVPGSGSFLDSLVQPIRDPWVTWGSGGADIEAVGAISQRRTYATWDAGRGQPKGGNGDGDRWTNFEEHAYRLDGSRQEWAEIGRLEPDPGGWLRFVFPRDERNADVRYVVQVQRGGLSAAWVDVARLGPLDSVWFDAAVVAGVEAVRAAPQASVGVLQEVRVRLLAPGPASGAYFARLVAEEVAVP